MLEQDIKLLLEKAVISKDRFSHLFPDVFKRIVDYSIELSISDWKEMKYLYINQIKERPVCKICGKPVKFQSMNKGYTDTCSRECDKLLKSRVHQKIWNNYTKEEKEARLLHAADLREEKTGYRTPFSDPKIRKQIDAGFLEKYGTIRYISEEGRKRISKSRKDHYQEINKKISTTWSKKTDEEKHTINQKRDKTCLERFGVDNYSKTDDFSDFMSGKSKELWKDKDWREKVNNTCLEKFGTMWSCLAKHVQDSNGKQISRSNKEFINLLEAAGIKNAELEFSLNKYAYDIKVRDILIEINPTYTHNSTIGPYFHGKYLDPKDKTYHYNKTKFAIDNNYRCIHIWDWDQIEKVIYLLSEKKKLYARNCEVREVDLQLTNEFLDLYHLQNHCRNQEIRLGLYYNNELVEIMTFGKPRYNKTYQYELLRLCSRPDYIIIGGAKKLFTYFIDKYRPDSIISYCDNSKFSGNVYTQLGMNLINNGKPGCHWYNIKTKQHITDSLLRQRGADQLLGTNDGKGANNQEIMIREGFVEVYDCGQSTYIWKKTQ